MRMESLRYGDLVELRLLARGKPLESEQSARQLLSAFDGAGPLRPESAMGKFRSSFDPSKLAARLVNTPLDPVLPAFSLTLRRAEPELDYGLTFNPPKNRVSLSATFPQRCVDDEAGCENLLALIRGVAAVVDPTYARCTDDRELGLLEADVRVLTEAPAQVDELYWLTLLGAELVERIGRDRVLSTPAHRVEALPYGGVLILLQPTPSNYASPDARRVQAHALAHLRPDLSEDELFAKLMQRSRELAPVDKRFDPDIADLLELVLYDASKSREAREIERLNAYHPPAVSEVLDVPLPADIDTERAIEDYGDAAEQLVALLRKDVPEIDASEPKVLPRIDYHLWHFGFAEYERADVENDLVPALGAYVGQMLVDRLGGAWVPRRTLDESQVVIGGKAFLPFLRARHALASRQAQLDHSMTQFFQVASRMLGSLA